MIQKYWWLALAAAEIEKLSEVINSGNSNLTISETEQAVKYTDYQKIYIGFDGIYTFFQDVKYSDVHYRGFGPRLSLGFEKRKNYLCGIDLNFNYSEEKASTYSVGEAMVLNLLISTKYLFPLYITKTQKFFLGGTWDLLDLYYRNIEELGNNSQFFISGSNLKLSSIYERKISENMNLEAGITFQLFGFMKELISFGFSAPQDYLEQGKFNYQDTNIYLPTELKSYNFEPFWNYLNIGTSLKLHYTERWTLAYIWNMQRSYEVKDYPLTRGYHSISLIYNIGK